MIGHSDPEIVKAIAADARNALYEARLARERAFQARLFDSVRLKRKHRARNRKSNTAARASRKANRK